ncbi:hypothetical protein [Corallococcus sp. 4LFB]|uniref:hypothetical protein n=1 Tax=Corallococcus sp. 4LFB TaxID=3383249 RepID=UPI0039757045
MTSGTPRSDADRAQVDGERLVMTLSRYSADGTKRWAKEFERNRFSDLRVAGSTGADGAVFLSGNAFLYSADFGLGEAQDGFLVKFSQGGTPEWQRRVGQKVYAVSADAAGGVVALGEEWTTEAHTPRLVRYAADGEVRWTKTFNGAKDGTLLSAVALSATGTSVVAGRLVGPVTVDGRTFDAQGTGGFVVLAFGADGALAWGREVPGVNGRVGSVSVGQDGTVAVAGEAVGLLVWNGVALDEGGPFVLTAGADGQERLGEAAHVRLGVGGHRGGGGGRGPGGCCVPATRSRATRRTARCWARSRWRRRARAARARWRRRRWWRRRTRGWWCPAGSAMARATPGTRMRSCGS